MCNAKKSAVVPPTPKSEGVTKPPMASAAAASSIEGKDKFFWSDVDEPHAIRRKQILAKYPEIKKLYGHDPKTKYVVLGVVSLQCAVAYAMGNWVESWALYVATAYCVGATCNHWMMMALHELSHNLGFRSFWSNKAFSLFANLPIGIPAAISFKRYHMEHHKFQGEDQVDVDIPSELEGHMFQSTITKFLFVLFQGFFYAIRPLMISPKKPGPWELANFCACITFDLLVLRFMGLYSMLYLLLSTFFGMGLHPTAGHFIAEHYVFTKGDETYSYYGFWNNFTFNVGYHWEHHDFPYVPGSRLPQLRAIAAEFYDPVPQHSCWVTVLYKFITDPTITAFSRVKRQRLTNDEIKKLKVQ